MQEYMPFTPGMFNDVLKTLGIVDYYLDILDKEVGVKSAELALNKAAAEAQFCGTVVRDDIYAAVMADTPKTGADAIEALKDILKRYREHKQKASPYVLLHQISSEAAALFNKFDEEGFIKACEETGMMQGAKEAKTAEASARAALSKARKALSDARKAYKTGIFTLDSPVFSEGLTEDQKEQLAVDRAKSFVHVWEHRAIQHSAKVTIECTDIKSLPDAGGVKKTWENAYSKLFGSIKKKPHYIARISKA
ncbi:hypothetical protein UFOVP785_15 [uncultured Caudovirales phage]|uniref:Uncharacterized protein n=1 Tax=uncultured Caudovirales phage TaxID=2100421 RepID=A0A6J5NQV6_9CAUD|nr:hypothetical protein UFOVP785_15 [uncultured Caudovirales phage]